MQQCACVCKHRAEQPHTLCAIKGLGLLHNKPVCGFGYPHALLATTSPALSSQDTLLGFGGLCNVKSVLPCTGGNVRLNSLSQMGIFQFSYQGRGRRGLCWRTVASNFSTLPRVGWDNRPLRDQACGHHFNPPTPGGVGHQERGQRCGPAAISIRPPRVGWDAGALDHTVAALISIPPPGRGGTSTPFTGAEAPVLFQSTHPGRGGTCGQAAPDPLKSISIHPPGRGGT